MLTAFQAEYDVANYEAGADHGKDAARFGHYYSG